MNCMESSASDDSFVWMSSSNDSSDSDSEANMSAVQTKAEEGDSADNKKKLQKRLFDTQDSREEEPPRKRKKLKHERAERQERGATPAPSVKQEPDSDEAAADTELARRVKQEPPASRVNGQLVDVAKFNSTINKEGFVATSDSDLFVNDDRKSKKKKNKKRKRESSLNTDVKDMIVEDLFSSEETVVESRQKKAIKASNKANSKIEITHISKEFVSDGSSSSNDNSRKKKKKRKNRNSETQEIRSKTSVGDGSLNTDVKDMIVEDLFSAEETVVESRQKKAIKASNKANSKIEVTHISKEFVSDGSSSSNDNSRKKKRKNRNSETQEIRSKTSVGDGTRSQIKETHNESVKSTHLKHKISDRICYEEEDDSQAEKMENTTNGWPHNITTQSTRLKRFLKSNPQLKAFTTCAGSNMLITGDDEVWVFKCPHEVDISTLKGKVLQLDTKCKLKIDGQAYDGSLNEERSSVAILSCENNRVTINNIAFIGTVHFRKRIPKPYFVEDNIVVNNQTNFIPLPDTKCRHPLFGSDYKKAMKIPSAIKKRLKSENEPQQEHSLKKKKKKYREQEYEEATAAAAHPTQPAHPARSKRKHRHAADDGDVPPIKKSKIIKNEVSADTWESEKAIEENLFNF